MVAAKPEASQSKEYIKLVTVKSINYYSLFRLRNMLRMGIHFVECEEG